MAGGTIAAVGLRGRPLLLLAGVALASAILPPEHRTFPARLKLLSVPAELALAAWLAWSATRIVRSMRASGASLPFEDALGAAGRESPGS